MLARWADVSQVTSAQSEYGELVWSGHIVSRDFQRSPAFTTVLPHSQDGPVRRHVVEDSPGLPEYDILGEFVVFRGRF